MPAQRRACLLKIFRSQHSNQQEPEAFYRAPDPGLPVGFKCPTQADVAKEVQLQPNWLHLQLHLKLASTLRWSSFP